jgi:hypothetical protein
MDQIEGYVDANHPNHVLLLRRALYGLKQAARAWNIEQDAQLKKLDFHPLEGEPCVYVHRNPESNSTDIILCIYVDDIVAVGVSEAIITERMSQLNNIFPLTSNGRLKTILGMKVIFSKDEEEAFPCITLAQDHYISKLAAHFQLDQANPIHIPMEPSAISFLRPYDAEHSVPVSDRSRYATAIGSLLYLAVCTRPDISLAVSFLARFMSNPGPAHWAAVKRLIIYCHTTRHLGLRLSGRPKVLPVDGILPEDITSFSDSDWACAHDRQSITGYITFLFSAPVHWKSQKQPCVALSTTEAEIIAASSNTRDLVWIRRLYAQLVAHSIPSEPGLPSTLPATPLLIDNSGAIALCQDPAKVPRRSKHIEMRHFHVRDLTHNHTVIPIHVSSLLNTADVLTKPLPRPAFEYHRDNLAVLRQPTS